MLLLYESEGTCPLRTTCASCQQNVVVVTPRATGSKASWSGAGSLAVVLEMPGAVEKNEMERYQGELTKSFLGEPAWLLKAREVVQRHPCRPRPVHRLVCGPASARTGPIGTMCVAYSAFALWQEESQVLHYLQHARRQAKVAGLSGACSTWSDNGRSRKGTVWSL